LRGFEKRNVGRKLEEAKGWDVLWGPYIEKDTTLH
jgi:hypothetical protein